MSQTREEDIQFLENKVRGNPESILFARLADLYLKSNRISDAIQLCEEGIKRYPFYATGHFVLGKGYLANKQFEQAEKEFKRVLLFDPKYLAAHKNYGDLMKEIGWENTCESSYRKILQIDPLDEIARSVVGEYVVPVNMKTEAPGATDNGAPPPAELESQSLGSSEETVMSVPQPIEEPADEEGIAPEDTVPGLDEPEPETSEAEAAPKVVEPEDENPGLATAPPDSSPLKEPEAFEFNATDWDDVASDKKAEPASEDPFDFDSLGPMPVDSDEEEDLLFSDGETSTDKGKVQDGTPELSKDSQKEEEFSYLLDDIFKDEVTSENQNLDFSIDEPTDAPVKSVSEEDDAAEEDEDSRDPWDGLQMDAGADDVEEPSEDSDAPDSEKMETSAPAEPTHKLPGSEPEAQSRDSEDEASFESILNESFAERASGSESKPEPQPSPPKVEHQPIKGGRSSGEKIVTPTLGEIYAAQGQYSKAIDVFETLLKKYPDNDLYIGKIEQLKKKLADEAQS